MTDAAIARTVAELVEDAPAECRPEIAAITLDEPYPCSDCPHIAACAAEREACQQFASYVRGLPEARWRKATRQPTAGKFAQVFGLPNARIMPKVRRVLSAEERRARQRVEHRLSMRRLRARRRAERLSAAAVS